ncbi:ABC transporter substrate-binding protein [Actinomarinicola tropica]|uniref:Solute-binding protein family 5 domain-containing protein n=1 Tax=Actinomarinicola tropica TaxID=2789776 RepID=A0A5Q2RG86_9ACTN|nr:ABC transporter substrate-binding protein [Actinomarinicola tropica]QGG94723.1 hypothetical protein GH723_06150 [Actinomarinicola tropica]
MKHSRRPLWRLLAALAALGLVAGACGDDDGGDAAEGSTDTTFAAEGGAVGEQEEATAAYGGRIVVGLEAESTTWTPGTAQLTSGGLTVANAIYDPLIARNADGEYQPFLAESLEPNDDLSEWTLTLRDGVTFHDGTPLDAETLKWNFDTLHFENESGNTRGALLSAGVTGMEVVDDRTVVYQLSGPNAAFPDLLRGLIGMPVSRTAYEADPAAFGDAPVGTGPFVFSSWVRNGSLTVERNPDYWLTDAEGQQLPYLDGIEFRPIEDEDSRSLSLQSNDIQVLQTLRGATAKKVLDLVEDDSRDYAALTYVGNESGSAIFNTLRPPLDDVRVRRALALASDGELVAEVLGDDGLVPRSPGFFSADSPWYSEEASATYPGIDGRDLEAATALIDEYVNDPNRSDGKAPGEPVAVEYACLPDATLIAVAQLQQSLWSEAGVEVSLKQVEQAELISNAVGSPDQEQPWSGTFLANCWRSPAVTGDPLTDFQSFFGDPATSTGNFTNYSHPEIDAALETLRTSSEFEERYAAVEAIQLRAYEDVPIAFSSGTPILVGFRGDIHGIDEWGFADGNLGSGITGGVIRFHSTFMSVD